MKILVISGEVWQDKTNGGNVLTNMFRNSDWEFAQIYCNPGMPENNICKKYYQMTDSMVIRNFILHRPIGKYFVFDASKQDNTKEVNKIEMPNKNFYKFFRSHRLGIFYFIKHRLWNISNWNNNNLKKFLDEYAPDIIFAPCYGDKFMLRLTRFVGDYTGKKIISYVSDDVYTLKQFNLSPFFWLDRFSVRNQLRKTISYYSLIYTMTDAQKRQFECDFNANMKILRKSTPYFLEEKEKKINNPLRLVYAGGIYLNRWKTLKILTDVIKEINKGGVKIILDIYTANEITKKINKALNDGVNSFIHAAVSQKELQIIYQNCDIALHVESFDIKNKLLVRMSFSTKIIDCLSSGCAVMAICDEKQGGIDYLKKEEAAICISDLNDIYKKLIEIVEDNEIVYKYKKRAKECCLRNHDVNQIEDMIKKDFESLVN